MKKIIFSLFIASAIFSCKNGELEAEKNKLLDDLQSMRTESAEKDSSFAKVLSYFSEIQGNLNEIKKREGIVSEVTESGDGLNDAAKNSITDDLEAIKNLMAENRSKITELRGILKKNKNTINSKNAQISELEASLENTLETLNQTILQKDSEIAVLQEDLTKLRISYDLLSMENTENLETIDNKTAEINTAYYCYGTYKELKEKGVLTKEGGVIGIGRTVEMKDNANLDYFTKVDITSFDEVELNTKGAELVSEHPNGSYKFTTSADGKTTEFLVIEDAKKFWSISKYLIIQVK